MTKKTFGSCLLMWILMSGIFSGCVHGGVYRAMGVKAYIDSMECDEPTVTIDRMSEAIADYFVTFRRVVWGRAAGKDLKSFAEEIKKGASVPPGMSTEIRGLMAWSCGYLGGDADRISCCQPVPLDPSEDDWREALSVCSAELLSYEIARPAWEKFITSRQFHEGRAGERLEWFFKSDELTYGLFDAMQIINALAVEAVIGPAFWTNKSDVEYREVVIRSIRDDMQRILDNPLLLRAMSGVAYVTKSLSEWVGQFLVDIVSVPLVGPVIRWLGEWFARESIVFLLTRVFSFTFPPDLIDYWLCRVASNNPEYVDIYHSFHDNLRAEIEDYRKALDEMADALPGSAGEINERGALLEATTARMAMTAFHRGVEVRGCKGDDCPPPLTGAHRDVCYIDTMDWVKFMVIVLVINPLSP